MKSPAPGVCRLPNLIILAIVVASLSNAEARSADHIRVSFRNEVMAVLSRSGCNLGTCHGSANGKGGLKLSLRGQDPDLDFNTLTREYSARRVNVLNPDESLLLQKPLMLVPHEGGRRFEENSFELSVLRKWIENGIPSDHADEPTLQRITTTPEHLTTPVSESPVQIIATGCFSDGSTRDITSLAVFDSSSLSMPVTRKGQLDISTPGLTTLTVRYLHLQQPVRVEVVADRPDFEFTSPEPANFIDELVFAQLERLKVNPSAVCDDRTFLRRAWLDVTGQLPPASLAKDFVTSGDANKRSAMIDQVLASDGFIDQQTMRWAELLRAEEKTLDSKGLQVYHQWIREAVAKELPLNQMAAELISARGSTYAVPSTNFFRAVRTYEDQAESTAQVFLGIRLSCAKCHNHPFDRWTQDDYYGWANFFARIDYEIVENKRRDKNDKHEFVGEQIVKIKDKGEIRNVRTGQPADLRFLGESEEMPPEMQDRDRLQILAAWLSDPQNRRFARTQANRIWYQMFGRGIVDPIDDFRATNPPVNPELLEALTDELIRSNFNTRHVMRLIMNSRVWQLSATTNSTNQLDEECFSHVIPRRLTAEQTVDAISTVLEVPIPFGGHEPGTKATQLVGVRNGEFRYAKPEAGDEFLKLFGRPNRLQSCECERSNESTLAQTLELVSGDLVTRLLTTSKNRISGSLADNQPAEEFLEELYWTALTRQPTETELKQLAAFIRMHTDPLQARQDITWAVINSNEFLLRY
ncbi:MAG: DUF1549 and DUF1553 domain-containing protein [Planctomycetaceae bacterium]